MARRGVLSQTLEGRPIVGRPARHTAELDGILKTWAQLAKEYKIELRAVQTPYVAHLHSGDIKRFARSRELPPFSSSRQVLHDLYERDDFDVPAANRGVTVPVTTLMRGPYPEEISSTLTLGLYLGPLASKFYVQQDVLQGEHAAARAVIGQMPVAVVEKRGVSMYIGYADAFGGRASSPQAVYEYYQALKGVLLPAEVSLAPVQLFRCPPFISSLAQLSPSSE